MASTYQHNEHQQRQQRRQWVNTIIAMIAVGGALISALVWGAEIVKVPARLDAMEKRQTEAEKHFYSTDMDIAVMKSTLIDIKDTVHRLEKNQNQ